MSEDGGPIVGIDLGTTNSAVAIYSAGAVEVFPNALGDPLTPSVVAMDKRGGALLVGRTAKDIYGAHHELGAAAFKRGMGGGSSEELLAVYAIVNSVVLNVLEIERVGILVGGEPVQTLNGHIDLTRPLPPNIDLIVGRVA